MASYSKQMIEVAKEWLTANPDPTSPFLKVPGLDRNRKRRRERVSTSDWKRYEAAEKRGVKIGENLTKLRAAMAEIDETVSNLHNAEAELEELVSATPVPLHSKRSVDDRYHADLGRWCLAWARHGYNVFDLSADFTAAMLLTDARELDIAAVRLPFNGVLILIPDGFARGAEGNSYTRIHVTEIPRGDITQLEVANAISSMMSGLPQSSIEEVLRNAERNLDKVPPKLVQPKTDPNDTAIHIYASDGAHVLDTIIDRKGLTWEAFDSLPDEFVTEDADRQARHTIRQVVFGAFAYIGAVSTALTLREPTGKRREPKDEPALMSWEVGRTIKIDRNLVRSVRAGAREIALRLKHRHIVRGHYRNQAHGVRFAERKQIWITCFWKGPEEGAALVHTYKLDGEKTT